MKNSNNLPYLKIMTIYKICHKFIKPKLAMFDHSLFNMHVSENHELKREVCSKKYQNS